MNNTMLIAMDHISKTHHSGDIVFKALDGINLRITHGEYLAILGPSGSGKSTLMNLLGCLDTPSSGSYRLNGKEISEMTKTELATIRNQFIGFVFQSFHLLSHASTVDNVALPLIYRGVGTNERTKRAIALLEQLGLGQRLKNKPNELSGGQRQRVAIARALVGNPDVIFADEPTGNLDSHTGNEVINIFEKLSCEGKTIIVVTHDTAIAKRTKRIIRIQDGHLVADDKLG